MSEHTGEVGGARRNAAENSILLLIDHDQNRRLLADWLASTHEVVLPDGESPDGKSFPASFDLCIVDESSFIPLRDELNARKETAAPTFLPYLLVTSSTSPARTPEVWQGVDEVITAPIEKAVLQERIDGLLDRRKLSVELEREKKQSEERFQSLFQTAPDPVFVLDADGRLQAVNDAFCELVGMARSRVLGRTLEEAEAFPNDTLEKLTADVRAERAGSDHPPYSITYTTPDDETRYAEINTATVPLDDGPPEVIGVFRDVTEHKRRKQELKRQNERLDEFASMLAHELRNPLGIGQGYLRVARKDGTPEAFDEVHEALARMERMINEMLDLARRPDAIDDTETKAFRDIVEDAWSRVAPPEATLVLRNADADVQADVDRLSQVFENLFRNAVEHAGSTVTVRVERLSDGIYVADDGPGISADRQDEVFESGYTTNDGTGLGLSIVEQIVDAHGWDISVTESEDGGARFEIVGIEFR